MKLNNWTEANIIAKALNDFLCKHCPHCGKRLTNSCIDGSQCIQCGEYLNAVIDLADAVKQAKNKLNI